MKTAISFLTDRLKRMINASGFKGLVGRVEALMFRHPAIPRPASSPPGQLHRGRSGESGGGAALYPQDTTEQQIIDWCRENMAVLSAAHRAVCARLAQERQWQVMWRALQEARLAADQAKA